MRTAKDTVRRQWILLREIPRAPRSIGTRTLGLRLNELGYRVDIRTIQRDLVTLSTVFPLSTVEEGRASRWFWGEDAPVMDVPGMDVPMALAFRLAQEHITPLLPQVIVRHLAGHFRRAGECLARGGANHFSLWPEKVCTVTRGPALVPPMISQGVQGAVEQALIGDQQLEVVYRAKQEKEAKQYVIHPCGLVIRDGIFYLIGTVKDYPDVRHLALHRMTTARVLSASARRPKGFTLKKYVREEQFFAYPVTKSFIRLEALFDSRAAVHLSERLLAQDQRITAGKGGRIRLQATMKDTLELRWWLLGFGDKVEVLAPRTLREEFTEISRRLAERYHPTRSGDQAA
jgi:predicted DNA-binding transcriptional regulator YafY